MKVINFAIFTMILFGIYSCHSKCDDSASKSEIGRYVYKGIHEIIHSDENCPQLLNELGKVYIDTFLFGQTNGDIIYCTQCVNADNFIALEEIAKRNRKFYRDRKWLYDKFCVDYDMGCFDDFVRQLSDKDKRKRAYNAGIDKGWDLGTFKEFSEYLGFPDADSQETKEPEKATIGW